MKKNRKERKKSENEVMENEVMEKKYDLAKTQRNK